MKQTVGKAFFDSNIIVYCYTKTETTKREKAFEVIDNCIEPFVSIQVVQEFCNVIHKKFPENKVDLNQTIDEIESIFSTYKNTIDTIRKANDIKTKYGFSFFDSHIVAVALQCGCKILYSEDLQHGQVIEKKLKVINPFKK